MSEMPINLEIPIKRISEGDDRWRCANCGGYVRGNAPMCKHCKLPFGAPEPLPPNDTGIPHNSPGLVLVAIGLWVVIAGLVYVSWSVGTTLGGVTGSIVGPFLFVTLSTPLYALWVHTAYVLPKLKFSAFSFDLLGVWTILGITLALPLIVALIPFVLISGWAGDSIGLLAFSIVFITNYYHAPRLRRLFDGPMSSQLCANFEPKKPRIPYFKLLIEVLLVGVLPITFFTYIRSEYPSPYSGLASFSQNMWVLVFICRDYIGKAISRLLGRQPKQS